MAEEEWGEGPGNRQSSDENQRTWKRTHQWRFFDHEEQAI